MEKLRMMKLRMMKPRMMKLELAVHLPTGGSGGAPLITRLALLG